MYDFADNLKKFGEFGIVEEVYHPMVKVVGLPSVQPNEVVVFENGDLGEVLFMEEDKIEVLVFAKQPLAPRIKVTRSGEQLNLNISSRFLGMVVDPLGMAVQGLSSGEKGSEGGGDGGKVKESSEGETKILDVPPLSIVRRAQITEPLVTGVSVVDMLLPLGKGQRELVVGDRKTGKTAFVLSVIKKQVMMGSVVIYAAIGKQMVEIDLVKRWLEKEGLLENLVIVATTAHDAQSLIYLTPFTAMTLAEYFRDLGKDVLVVLDDLSTHAKYYREIALLAGRFPGRDSYPGDIFYTHARLLERAGNYVHPKEVQVAISCLPVAETTENDLTDYIVSNLIGITDGHLLFDSQEFIKGRRPAINPLSSVTRVGKQTQWLLHQNVSQQMLAFISEYERNLKFAHFGAELTDKMRDDLRKGSLMYNFFNQETTLIVPLNIQLLFMGMVWSRLFDKELTGTNKGGTQQELRATVGSARNRSSVENWRARLMEAYEKDGEFKAWIDELMKAGDLVEMVEKINPHKDKLLSICQVSNH